MIVRWRMWHRQSTIKTATSPNCHGPQMRATQLKLAQQPTSRIKIIVNSERPQQHNLGGPRLRAMTLFL
jgi:hypothetical protein